MLLIYENLAGACGPFIFFSYGNTVFTGWQDLMPYAILNTEIYGFRKEC